MKAISIFLLLVTFSFSAFGATPPDRKLALEYLKISRVEQSINASIDTYSTQLVKQLPQKDQADFDKAMHDTLGWDAVKDQLADVVIGLYTKEELHAAITFMKSPLGASITLKSDQFSAQYSAILTRDFSKFIEGHIPPKQPATEK